MKLETLNIWGGRIYEPLTKHVTEHGQDIDIFCFQEVYNTTTDRLYTNCEPITDEAQIGNGHNARINIFSELSRGLPEHIAVTLM